MMMAAAVQAKRDTPISLEFTPQKGRAPESSYFGRPTNREGTYFALSAEPDYLKSWLQFVEGGASRVATVITSVMPLPCVRDPLGVFGFLVEGDEALHLSATAVSVYALVNALFGHAIQLFAAVDARPITRLDDLRISYFANTTVDIAPASQSLLDARSEPIPLAPATNRDEPKSRITARDLADFMGITLEQLGAMTGIGRTTFSSWQTKNPRPSTLRDLYRLDGLIRSLRNTLGDEEACMWLRIGNPSPFSLLEMQRLADVERLVSPLLFVARPESKSFAVSPLDEQPSPARDEEPVPLRAKRRSIKGGLTSESR